MGLLFNAYSTKDYPKLVISKDLREIEGNMKNDLLGRYSRDSNTIYARLDYEYYDINDFSDTIWHEYSHYIYWAKMSKLEKKEFGNNFCNLNISYDGYGEKDYCEEQFVRGMAKYISENGWNYKCTASFTALPEMFDFFDRIFKEYYVLD
jgi:hypothetical protein